MAVRGARGRRARFGLPSDVRGIFDVGWLSHWALAGSATAADDTTIATVSAPLILTSTGGWIYQFGHLSAQNVKLVHHGSCHENRRRLVNEPSKAKMNPRRMESAFGDFAAECSTRFLRLVLR